MAYASGATSGDSRGRQGLRGAEGPEIGWAPVSLVGEPEQDPLFRYLPCELTVLHWHRDTFDLPPGATHLAASRAYPNQAFRAGPRAWGLQFHLEVDECCGRRFPGGFRRRSRRLRRPSRGYRRGRRARPSLSSHRRVAGPVCCFAALVRRGLRIFTPSFGPINGLLSVTTSGCLVRHHRLD